MRFALWTIQLPKYPTSQTLWPWRLNLEHIHKEESVERTEARRGWGTPEGGRLIVSAIALIRNCCGSEGNTQWKCCRSEGKHILVVRSQRIPQWHTTQQTSRDLLGKTQDKHCLCQGEECQSTEWKRGFLGQGWSCLGWELVGFQVLNLRQVQGHGGILSSGTGGFPSSETGGLSNEEMCYDFWPYTHQCINLSYSRSITSWGLADSIMPIDNNDKLYS